MTQSNPQGWRYRLGMILFFGAFPVFFATPVVVGWLGLPSLESATLIGAVLLLVEVLWMASIALLGKAGFQAVSGRALGWLKLARRPLSRARHYGGVVLLVASLVLDVLLQLLVMVQHFGPGDVAFAVSGRLYVGLQVATASGVLIALMMLGGDFWERIKQAFEWRPEEPER